MTIRERIKAISSQMLTGPRTPSELSEFEVALAGLLSHVNDELTDSELAFRKAVLAAEASSAVGKRQIAQAGPEYARFLEAQATYKSCDQMLKTCRSAIRLKTEELRARV